MFVTTLLPLVFISLALARPYPIKREDSALVALYPYYANQPADNLTTHQYSEVYVTAQYYAEPPSGMSWTQEDRFTTIMIESTDDSTTSGYLVYGYSGQSATQIQPSNLYSITNPVTEIATYSLPEMAAGSSPVKITSYLWKEPSSGLNNVIYHRSSFDVEKYQSAAGLGAPLAVNEFYVINGEVADTATQSTPSVTASPLGAAPVASTSDPIITAAPSGSTTATTATATTTTTARGPRVSLPAPPRITFPFSLSNGTTTTC